MDKIGLLVEGMKKDRLVICKKVIKILKWLFRLVELMDAMSKESGHWNLISTAVPVVLINMKWRKYFSVSDRIRTKNVICKFDMLAWRLNFILNSDLMENLLRKQSQLLLNMMIFTTWQSILGNRLQLVAGCLMPKQR